MVPTRVAEEKPTHEPESSPPRPMLPPPPGYLYAGTPRATVHFWVHPGMEELRSIAEQKGWLSKGWTVVTVPWLELHYTTDGWVTTRVLKSTDVPCPVINGYFYLPYVEKGQQVEFAVQAGVACRAPNEGHQERESSVVWFNNGGKNYRQHAR
jgi:hypothetical protein